MLIPVTVKKQPRLALVLPNAWNRYELAELRSGLLDMLMTCLATEDAKEATDSKSLFIAVRFIEELNKELEDAEKKRKNL